MCACTLLTVWILNYIQDNLSWALGFGIPCSGMIIALVVFLIGTGTCRYTIIQLDMRSPFVRIDRVFVAAIRNRGAALSDVVIDRETHGTFHHQSFQQLNFLNKALLAPNGSKEGETCSISEFEEAQAVLRLVPIWVTTLAYGIVFAQLSTFYTKQGATLNRKLFPGIDIPAATLQSFVMLGPN
ncbi:protein NRT1/ PTR FAMILY 5.10-like [Quillaja saponaria]|uniref:Protein NRT1/ PTR FAMILY 5.10-like n=1 Tax=Quillaja saponaria TaxID=32244 RepID=A0AAD7KVB8_QUISA|nr:protein NRT1/ PTR FAMILY 5.10-like [Quillaja saponaria]